MLNPLNYWSWPATSTTVEQQLRIRLAELKAEFEKGQKRLEELETEVNRLHQTLLRISGAVQVLEELQAQAEHQAASSSRPNAPEPVAN